MPTPTSPVVAGWELALRLRQRREQLKLDAKTVSDAMGFSRNYLSAIENEHKLPAEDQLPRLADYLGLNAEELLDLRTVARDHGWWTAYPMVDANTQRFFGLEAGAERVRAYENLLVPGLLQTADYAQALMGSAETVRSVEVDQLVELRIRRQEHLSGASPLNLTAVISEAVLSQQLGGPAIHRRQLRHLIEIGEEHPDSVQIRVIPFTATSCGLFGAPTIVILDFAGPILPTVVWHETVTASGVIDDPIRVRDLTVTYDSALSVTASAEETVAMIHRYIKDPT